MNWTLSLACLLGASCASATVRVSGEFCEVSVPASLGEHRATELARVADFLAPQVARCLFLPTATAIPIEVLPERHVDAGWSDAPGTYGAVWVGHRSRIVLGSVCLEEPALLNYRLAHELAHWHMLGTPWDYQPYLVQEVVADYISLLHGPMGGIDARSKAVQEIERLSPEPDRSVLRLTRDEVNRLSHEEGQRAILLAWQVVRTIGFVELPKRVLAGEPVFADL